MGFPDSSVGKESSCDAGDPGSIPGSGRSAGEGMGYQLQYSCFSAGKQSTCNAGDLGSIPGLGRSPGAGNGNPLQCSCLGNPMDRGAWQPIVHGVTKESDTAEQLGMQHACTPYQASTGHWREG